MKNKILLLLTLVTSTFMGLANVSADTNLVKEEYNGVYAIADLDDRSHLYYAERYIQSGRTAYCIDLGTPINSNIYSTTTDLSILNLRADILEYVKLVAYYGYDYSGHQTRNYYLASQELIWEKITNKPVRWVTEMNVNGTELNIEREKNEIINLVNNHYSKPSFDKQTVDVNIGESITLTDTNNVLSNYEITKSINNASINGNSINLTATESRSNNQILLTKKSYINSVIFVYYTNSGDQKMISAGTIDMPTATLNINTVGGNVTFEKLDSETGTNQPAISVEASLTGAVYGVYTTDGTLVDTLTSGTKNTSKDLPYNSYYLQEITPSTGYQLDTNQYYFTIDSNNIEIKQKVYEKIIERDFEFTKILATDQTGIMTPEIGVTFGIYNKDGKLIAEKTSDHEGKIYVTIPYGSYTLKQLTSTTNYEKIEDYSFEVKEVGDTINKVFGNAEITARLKVIKIDSESGNIIARANIKFKIFDVTNNKYVCQTITYPTAQTICVFETDSNGILITPYPISSGLYRLEEIDQSIDGYLWNSTSKEFEIGENSELITDSEFGIIFETKFENTPVKGEVSITKVGEELVIENGTYHYKEIKLDGVTYKLYANEDITSGDGTLIYHKGDLVGTYTTKDGLLKVENLYLGKYYFIETSTVDGHVLDTTKHYFELKYKDQYTPIVSLDFTLKNYLEKGTLVFTKTDLTSGKVIPNVKVQIFTENDELIYEGVTDKNGQIIIDDLFVGKFYIVETEAVDGYKLSDEKVYFEIKENGEIVKADMTNEKIVQVPNTGLSDSKLLNIIGLVLILTGVSYITYDKKKKN